MANSSEPPSENNSIKYNDNNSNIAVKCNGNQNDINNNNNNNNSETKTNAPIRPVMNGLYMLPLASLKLFKEDIITLLSIQNILVVSYSDEAGNMKTDFIKELNLSYQANNIKTICVHIPLSYDENGKLLKLSNNAPMTISDISLCFEEFNNTLKDLMDRKKRVMLIFSEQDYDIIIAMAASFMMQFCNMCMDASLKHICDIIKYPRVFVKSVWYNHLNIYRRFVRFKDDLAISCQQDARYRYEFFLNYVKKHKLEQLDSEVGKHRLLRKLLIEYANTNQLNEDRDENSNVQPTSHYCLHCHCFLFTDRNVLKTLDPMGKHFPVNSQKCKTIFIEPVKWMFHQIEPNADCIRSQVIYCPGCSQPIGCYSFRGIHCSFSVNGDVCLIHPDLELRIFRIDPQLVYSKCIVDINKLFNKRLPCLNDFLEKNGLKTLTDLKFIMKPERMKLLNCRYGNIKTIPSNSIAVRKIRILSTKSQPYSISVNVNNQSENSIDEKRLVFIGESIKNNNKEQLSKFVTSCLLSTKDKNCSNYNKKIKNYLTKTNRNGKKLKRDKLLLLPPAPLKSFIKKILFKGKKNGIKKIENGVITKLNAVPKHNFLPLIKFHRCQYRNRCM